jgi:protocatechuate 3,4-dioxygenase beta subunit
LESFVRAWGARAAYFAALALAVGAVGASAAQAQSSGAIHGTVTNADGTPLAQICVQALSSSAPVQTQTATDGSYALTVTPGQYWIQYSDCSGGDYVTQYWGRTGSGNPPYVAVADGQHVEGIDATLHPGGRIEGTVTDSNGDPVSDVQVDATQRDHGDLAGQAETDDSGRYVLHGMPADEIRIQFITMYVNQSGLAGQYYGGTQVESQSPYVSVSVGESTSGIDATLQRYATITGTVEDQAGHPLTGACVAVFYPGSNVDLSPQASTYTYQGGYRLMVAPDNDVRVRFDDCTGTLPADWFAHAPDYAHAMHLNLSEGESVSSIDGSIFWSPPAGSLHVAGTVHDSNGQPAVGVRVSAGGQIADSDGQGHFEVDNLSAQTYDISFRPNQQHQNLLRRDQTVDLSGGSVDGIDVTMPIGARILGTVHDAHGNVLQGICVRSDSVTGNGLSEQDTTDALGRYTLAGLSSGTERLRFLTCGGGNWASSYWHNEPDDASRADLVTVTAGSDTTNVDETMHPGGVITGTVTDSDGQPLDGMCVLVGIPPYDSVQVATAIDGTYRATGLATRSDYTVRVSDCTFMSGKYVPAWASPGGADRETNISVTAGQTVSGIDAVLPIAGSFSGSVVDQNGVRVPGVCVDALDNSGATVGNAVTDISGTYQVRGISTGTYRIRFRDCGADLRDPVTYYPLGSTDPSTAVPIVVAAGRDTGNVNTSVRRTSPPGPPSHVQASAGNEQATVTWTAPVDDGGAKIQRYDVVDTTTHQVEATALATARTAVVRGLRNGSAYRFVVEAANADGVGTASSAVTVVPVAPARFILSRRAPSASQPSVRSRCGWCGSAPTLRATVHRAL